MRAKGLTAISNMPPGTKRDEAIKHAVDAVNARILSYRQFIAWPALIESLRRERDALIALQTSRQSPTRKVGHSE